MVIKGALAGSVASILSAAVLLIGGQRRTGSAAAPINAVSHWWWGNEALHRRAVDVRHTALGYATHHMASVFWGLVLSACISRRHLPKSNAGIAAASAVTSAVACLVDFQMTPSRLTPGFEHRVSRPALATTYVAFAVGLAIGCIAARSSSVDRGAR